MRTVYTVDKRWVLGDALWVWTCGDRRGLSMDPIKDISQSTARRLLKQGKAVTFNQAMAALSDKEPAQ